MHRALYKFACTIMILIAVTARPIGVGASGRSAAEPIPVAAGGTYYVSPLGSDTNPGTSPSAPFQTFAKAVSVLTAGSTLNIMPGTYYHKLLVKQSGTASAPITIQGAKGAVISLQGRAGPGINLKGSYITVSGLEVKGVGGICVNLVGSYLTASGLSVHGCMTHGIHAYKASHIKILNNTVFHAVLQNASRSMPYGWGSAIKIRESSDVLIENNSVHGNYGEGMGTRAINITIRHNVVYDNYSVNIYTNSENATIEKNFVYCTSNSNFYRNGKPAGGIVMSEEYYEGWGARLKNARVTNNIVAYCKNGVRYGGASTLLTDGGLKYTTIANNTLFATVEATISIMYAPAQAGNVIANNIVWQANNNLVSIQKGVGLTFEHNLWKVTPPAVAQGPGDRVGGPGFIYGPPGANYDPAYYRPGSTSRAIGGAANLNVLDDYFNNGRNLPYDIGAIEAGG